MSNRLTVLTMIHTMMTRIKNAASREQRFTLLENAQILTDILQEVTQYERSLLMDMDVD
jgi:ribosomal protein S8